MGPLSPVPEGESEIDDDEADDDEADDDDMGDVEEAPPEPAKARRGKKLVAPPAAKKAGAKKAAVKKSTDNQPATRHRIKKIVQQDTVEPAPNNGRKRKAAPQAGPSESTKRTRSKGK